MAANQVSSSELKQMSKSDVATADFNVVSLDKPLQISDIEIPRKDHWLAMATFCLLGCNQLLIWNFVINSFVAMQDYIWPGNLFSDLLGGCEHAAALVVAIVFLKFDGLNSVSCTVWGILNTIGFIVFPLVPQFFHGNENIGVAKGLLCGISVFLGLCAGCMHTYGYAFASVLPRNYVAWVSTGNGVAGAYSFLVFLFFSEAVFPKDLDGQIKLIWVFFAFGAALSVCQVISFYYLSRKDWVKKCVELSKLKHAADLEQALKTFGERRGMLAILSDCWLQAFNASFSLFFTLFLFPVTGPFGWGKNYTISSALNGAFQIMDLLVRWMPVLGGWTKIPKKWLIVGVLLRPLIFLPLFMLPNRFPDIALLNDTWWLFIVMIVFTITSGWFVTLGSMYTPDCVTHPAEKEIAAEFFVIMLLFGVTVGVFASKVPVI